MKLNTQNDNDYENNQNDQLNKEVDQANLITTNIYLVKEKKNSKKNLSKEFNLNSDEKENLLLEKVDEMDSSKSTKEKELPEIDKLLDKAGYNFTTYKIIFFTWMILLIDGFHSNFFSSMIIPLTTYYKFSKMHLMILPGVIFLGNTLGSLSISTLTKIIERKNLINLAVILSCSFYALMIFVKDIYIFAICRFCIGYCFAISTNCSLGILTEYMPIRLRGFVLSSIWSAYTLGQLFMLIIMYYTMPKLEADKSFITMVIALSIPLFALVSTMLKAEDGPRNLILINKEDKAFEILETINKGPILEDVKAKIVEYTKSGANKKVTGSLMDIFKKDYLKTTVLLTLIRSNHALVNFGVLAINTLTLKYINNHYDGYNKISQNENDNATSIIVDEAYMTFIVVLSDFFAGIQAEIPFLGRKYSMLINYIIGFCLMIFSFIIMKYFSLFLGFSLCFNSVSSVISHTYALEVYSTKVRDNAIGFLFACRRIGGFLAQVLFVYFDSLYVWLPYYVSAFLLFLNVVFVGMLDKETYNQSIE